MKQRLIENIKNPESLEKMYRENKQAFSKSFIEVSEDFNSDLVRFWKIRLSNEVPVESKRFIKSDLMVVIILSLISGLLVKIPEIFMHLDKETFYARDLAIIVFNSIILYTFWQDRIIDTKKILMYESAILVLGLFINLLPYQKSDSITLSLIYTPLLSY